MFPIAFARQVIATYTQVSDAVLDPFAGRGTTLFCAAEANRMALGTELNPLGWIYGMVKLAPAEEQRILRRLRQIDEEAARFRGEAEALPEFFHVCFAAPVRRFLLAARSLLNWRSNTADRTLMAFILVYLHGKIEAGRPTALSNQMRQTKAMAPDYSIAWWRKEGFATPPEIDPVAFLRERIEWRYKKGAPNWQAAKLKLGDCRTILRRQRAQQDGRFRLLLTSPPYRGGTSYYYDQWLRLWLLGDAPHPSRVGEEWKGKFEDKDKYRTLLFDAFRACSRLMHSDGVIYVRTDARPQTLDVTAEALYAAFPRWRETRIAAPYVRATQTSLFGDREEKPGEVDIILTR
jgi:hypothetical protein